MILEVDCGVNRLLFSFPECIPKDCEVLNFLGAGGCRMSDMLYRWTLIAPHCILTINCSSIFCLNNSVAHVTFPEW